MFLHSIEKILVAALEKGRTPSIEELGGIRTLNESREVLSVSPLVGEFISIVLSAMKTTQSQQVETELGKAFIIRCFENVVDELVIKEAIVSLESHRPLHKTFETAIFKCLIKEAQNCKKPSITRAWSLEESFRLAVDNKARKYQLMSYLVELPTGDEPEYLRHAAKIIGLARTFWADQDMVSVLETLANETGTDEAYFELGLSSLASALDAESADMAKELFKEAQLLFKEAVDRRETRLDAEAFYASISILFSFEKSDPQESYRQNLHRLKQAVTLYEAWNESDGGEIWTSARKTEMAHWYTLTTKLEALSGYLTEPSWFEPILVIEQALLNIYTASRTIFKRKKDGALEVLLQPKIEATLVKNQGQLHLLEQWLERSPQNDTHYSGKRLVEVVNRQKEAISLGKQSGAISDLKKSAPDSVLPAWLSNDDQSYISQIWKDCVNLQHKEASPVLEEILKDCISLVSTTKDYQNDRTREIFNVLLFSTLRFLESRMDMTRANMPRLKYLFKGNKDDALPKEQELQADYYQYMFGNVGCGDLKVEVPNSSSGRVDVYFSFSSIRFIAEIKRDSDDCSFEALRQKYLGQAAEYQNTNVKIGFLLVLDLTEKPHGIGGIEENIRVENMVSHGGHTERSIVVVRVPGNRRVPSKVVIAS